MFYSRFIYKYIGARLRAGVAEITDISVDHSDVRFSVEGQTYHLEPAYVSDLEDYEDLFVLERSSIYCRDSNKSTD